ncbi:MAG: hypothetical protein IPG93_20680 [Burkholderiales bacterium]|nr:hypothetical protein [Burkholderiales bacterium]
MTVRATDTGASSPQLRSRLARQAGRDAAWLTAVRWLRLIVQISLLICLVVALRAAWQLNEALRWNVRLAQQVEQFGAVAEPAGADLGGGAGVLTGVGVNEAAHGSAASTGATSTPASGGAAVHGADVTASAASALAVQRERRATRSAAAAPVWADEVASAASAAAAAASAAAEAPQVPAWLTDGSPPQWRFAQALGLARQGDLDGALARYRSVFDDAALGNLARYNSANTLLREAMRLSATAAPGQALVMFELAKEGYRGVLRRDPSFWAARYNLERALLLQPDGEAVAAEPAQQAERAATTMRSVSRGLP